MRIDFPDFISPHFKSSSSSSWSPILGEGNNWLTDSGTNYSTNFLYSYYLLQITICTLQRLIHTRCYNLRILQWTVALPRRDRKILISVLTQSTAESTPVWKSLLCKIWIAKKLIKILGDVLLSAKDNLPESILPEFEISCGLTGA